MSDSPSTAMTPEEAQRQVDEIVAGAGQLGVEVDREEAIQWIVAMSAAERDGAFAQDAQSGVFGHRVALMDFDTDELDYFRRLAQKVRVERRPGVESAIAIAGSSAQGKVQLFPGDCDFFERVNIRAETIDDAQAVLREVMRATALRAFGEKDIVLVEVNFGVYPQAVRERGEPRAAGDSITWTPQNVAAGYIEVESEAGEPLTIRWEDAQAGLGWSYLGWIVADRGAGRIALASNMLDVTWEDDTGHITPLDGSIDPFFQEIYLEPEAVPIFRKIIKQTGAGALNSYASAMRGQAFHYTRVEPNYGKAAKRLYNLFRLTDQLEAAAYVRELFDEPGAQLYQVPGLLEAADVAHDERSGMERETVIHQIDHVIRAVAASVEGPAAGDIVMELVHLRDSVIGYLPDAAEWSTVLRSVRGRCSAIVNEYFRTRLLGLPQIAEFVQSLEQD